MIIKKGLTLSLIWLDVYIEHSLKYLQMMRYVSLAKDDSTILWLLKRATSIFHSTESSWQNVKTGAPCISSMLTAI